MDAKGFSPLILATYNGNLEAARRRLEAGADVNPPEPNRQHGADGRILLSKGADKTLKNSRGITALGLAQQQNNSQAIRLLQ